MISGKMQKGITDTMQRLHDIISQKNRRIGDLLLENEDLKKRIQVLEQSQAPSIPKQHEMNVVDFSNLT